MTLIEHLPAVLGRYMCPPLSLACFSSSQAGVVREGTPAKLWKPSLNYDRQKHKPQNPCGGPNSLACTNWGYSNVRPFCRGVNLWKCWYQIGYQSQQACCFKLILWSPGKLLLCESLEKPVNVSPSATWSITDRVTQLPVLSTLCAQQGHSNIPFQHGSQEALEKSHSQAVQVYARHVLNVAVAIYYHLLKFR